MSDDNTQETITLFNEIIRLATEPGAPIERMEPIEMLTSAASLAIEARDDKEGLLGILGISD